MKKHLKRLAAPRSWPLPRKTQKWVVRPSPGPHPQEWAIPLGVVLRDILGHCDTGREAKRIIGSREILVDGKPVTSHKHPVGLMDVVSVPAVKEHYRFLLDNSFRQKDISRKSRIMSTMSASVTAARRLWSPKYPSNGTLRSIHWRSPLLKR